MAGSTCIWGETRRYRSGRSAPILSVAARSAIDLLSTLQAKPLQQGCFLSLPYQVSYVTLSWDPDTGNTLCRKGIRDYPHGVAFKYLQNVPVVSVLYTPFAADRISPPKSPSPAPSPCCPAGIHIRQSQLQSQPRRSLQAILSVQGDHRTWSPISSLSTH